jgi:hypothetical protein
MILRPTPGKISSAYGWRMFSTGPDFHAGIDFSAKVGTPVYAVHAGTVFGVFPNGALNKYGNVVVIKHDSPADAPYSLYAHLSRAVVSKGQHVAVGQKIAETGTTGGLKGETSRTVPPHLHFEMLKGWPPTDSVRINPTKLISGDAIMPDIKIGPSATTAGLGFGSIAALLGLLWWMRRPKSIRNLNGLPNGKAKGRRVTDFDPAQLKRGSKVEREHTSNPKVAQRIAMDHLVEDPRYYQKLAKMHLDGAGTRRTR